MHYSNFFKSDVKTFTIVNFATAFVMIFGSIIGHYLTPNQLIPSAVSGGVIGLLVGVYFSVKLNCIDRKYSFQVFLASLYYFGLMAFLAVFNLHNPVFILIGFSLTGFVTIISNWYLVKHPNLSISKIYGLFGLLFAFPALYFMVASLLKFQLGEGLLFNMIERLLNRTNGQENFNAITPFIFGGGLMLAFALNLFSQIEKTEVDANFRFSHLQIRVKTLNFIVVLLSGFVGLAILSYLAVENL